MATATENAAEQAVEAAAEAAKPKKERYDFAKERGITDKSLTADAEIVAEYFEYRKKSLSDSDIPAPLALKDDLFKNVVESSKFRVQLLTTRKDEKVADFEASLEGLNAKIREYSTIVEKADEVGPEKAIKFALAQKKAAELKAMIAELEDDDVDTSGILEDDDDEV